MQPVVAAAVGAQVAAGSRVLTGVMLEARSPPPPAMTTLRMPLFLGAPEAPVLLVAISGPARTRYVWRVPLCHAWGTSISLDVHCSCPLLARLSSAQSFSPSLPCRHCPIGPSSLGLPLSPATRASSPSLAPLPPPITCPARSAVQPGGGEPEAGGGAAPGVRAEHHGRLHRLAHHGGRAAGLGPC